MQGQLQKATQEWASLFINLPWKKWWRSAPTIASFVLVVLVAKSAADVTWIIFAPDEAGKGTGGKIAQAPRSNTQSASNSQLRLRTVASLHLFGEANRKTANVKVPTDAPPTSLKLTLKGVFAANTQSQSLAIIVNDQKKEKVYAKNETIFPGTVLHEIHADKVILDRNGNFEVLALERKQSGPGLTGLSGSRGQATRPQAVAPRSSAAVRTRTIRGGKLLENLKVKLTEDPTSFMADIKLNPVFDDSKQVKGYKFEHKDRQTMRALGLRPGDVIMEINGQQVSDPAVLTGLFTELKTKTDISLGIERNGHRENINIKM